MRIAAALALALVTAGCSPATPPSAPGQAIHVVNDSNRAVMLMTGGPLGNHRTTTAAAPCGGQVSLAVSPASYEQDGRLMSFLSIDPNGAFDVALKAYQGDPIDMPGSFSASPIWSDGTLAGRLPIYLTVAADLTVTESAAPSLPSAASCAPAY
jgi:hypothetical protein